MEENIDMTASLWGDLLKGCKGDKQKAQQMLKGMKKQNEEEKQREKDRKVREVEVNFPDLPKETIAEVLSENDWDVERAILPLFEAAEKERQIIKQKEMKEHNMKREQEALERKQEAQKQAKAFLTQLFSNVPEQKIQKMLEDNEGDVDMTTDQLLTQIREEDEKKKKQEQEKKKERERERERKLQEEQEQKRRQEAERKLKLDTLKQKYISPQLLIKALIIVM